MNKTIEGETNLSSDNGKKFTKKYIKQLNLSFPYKGKQEKIFLKRLQQNIEEYLDDFPNASFEDLVAQFGNPREISVNYYYELDNCNLIKKIKFKKHILYVSIVIIMMTALLTAYKTIKFYQEYLNTLDAIGGYDTEQIIYTD